MSPQQPRNFYRKKMLMEITPFTTVSLWGPTWTGVVNPIIVASMYAIQDRLVCDALFIRYWEMNVFTY